MLTSPTEGPHPVGAPGSFIPLPPRPQLWRDQRLRAVVVATAVAITVGHVIVPMDFVVIHNLLRRLYYVPIVVAAVGFGARGGLLAAAGCALAYLPHAFFMGHDHAAGLAGHVTAEAGHPAAYSVFGVPLSGDPSPSAEKFVELAVFHGVGWLAGMLSDRWVRALRESEALARRLETALDERDRVRTQLVRSEKLSALGHLSAGLAHEIRNPLSSIRGSAEVLVEDIPPSTPKARLASILLDELQRLEGVLTQFLQFARPPHPEPSAVDVGAILDEVDAMTAAVRGPAGIVLQRTAESRVAIVWADPAQVKQVLINLVRNAMDAMEGGGTLVLALRPTLLRGAQALAVDVKDSGAGIPVEIQSKIFEPYFTTKDTGTGLGLSISHALVEANAGLLDVESAPGRGTTFTMTLPVRQAEDP
ncbi:MAG: hypothetical protein HY904_14500 [Deltaproteobacteria bacterium]|nr:hypothetical protein [Deltaproteobacteria bacterium]